MTLLLLLATLRTYVHPTCGYSFKHHLGWTVTRVKKHECRVLLRAPTYAKDLEESEFDVDTIAIDAGPGNFDDGAEAAEFEKVTDETAEQYHGDVKVGSWVVEGRFPSHRAATPISFHKLRGLRADEVDYRVHRTDGTYAGLGERSTAFLTNGKRWVTFDAPANVMQEMETALKSTTIR